MRSMGKGKSMTDVEKEIDELQGKLSAKTREIEALLAEELNLGNIHAMRRHLCSAANLRRGTDREMAAGER